MDSNLKQLEQELTRLRQENLYLQNAFAFTGHEWRNRVFRVRLIAETLLREDSHPLSEPQQRMIEQVLHSATMMGLIADKFIANARLQGSDLAVDPVYIDPVREVINPLLADFALLLKESRQSCSVRIPHQRMLVWADKFLFSVLYENLLNNAIRHGEPGGRIEFVVRDCGRLIEFSVWNSGPGIAPDRLEDIFNPFVRGKGLGNGTGIGLYLASRIVNAHRGHIWAESIEGCWARIVFTLPTREWAGQIHLIHSRPQKAIEEPITS